MTQLPEPQYVELDDRSLRIGVDVGGTFTDLVVAMANRDLHVTKVPSDPSNPSDAVLRALEAAAQSLGTETRELLARCTAFVHGSTVATNTVLEGNGARVGLLVTPGFRDTLEIRRGIRDNPWDHRTPYPEVLVPRYLRLSVAGRLDSAGHECANVDDESLNEALATFRGESVESIAICLLNSYVNPNHERYYSDRIRSRWQQPTGRQWLSVSSDIIPMLGEYERTATTVLNAYIAPRTVSYLQALDQRLTELGLKTRMLLIQNNGGSVSTQQVSSRPVTLLLSGPAAGAGALQLTRETLGTDNLLSLEIGGTSADVMLMDNGRIPITEKLQIGGYDAALPSVDIHTIGAGGGTIAHVDNAGLLQVGPHGAGANPGPAAYALGATQPTVTDALVVLGRLRPGPYAGGAVTLDEALAREAIATHVAQPLAISVEDAASGVVRLLEQNLLQALERMTYERGVDARRFTLVAAGGAGPMHAASIARRLGCTDVYIPRLSGAFCALGMLHTDVRHDVMQTWLHPLDDDTCAQLPCVYEDLCAQGLALVRDDGFDPCRILLNRELDLRYSGQQWSIRVVMGDGDDVAAIRQRFEQAHEARYRHIQPDGKIEITALHVIAHGLTQKLTLPEQPRADSTPQTVARRKMYFDDEHQWVCAQVFHGPDLQYGHEISGPAIIEEHTTTVCIGPYDRVIVDRQGNFRLRLADSGE